MEEKRKSSSMEQRVLYAKFRQGEMIHSQAKRVILNVFANLSANSPDKSWNKIAQETANLVGTSSKMVLLLKNEKMRSSASGAQNATNIATACTNQETPELMATSDNNNAKEDGKRKRKVQRSESPRSRKRKYTQVQKKRIDRYPSAVLEAIRAKMTGYRLRNEKPSFNRVLEEVNKDSSFPFFSKFTFRSLLRDLGLKGYCAGRWPDKSHQGDAPVTNEDPKMAPYQDTGGRIRRSAGDRAQLVPFKLEERPARDFQGQSSTYLSQRAHYDADYQQAAMTPHYNSQCANSCTGASLQPRLAHA